MNYLKNILSLPTATTEIQLANSLIMFSNIGVLFLLFMVGLESSVEQMKSVGKNALGVAMIGIVLPFALGLGTTYLLLPSLSNITHIFLAAALCATSVGITARVFKDMNRITSIESRTVLGAAVIDDVLGLVILAVVVGVATTGIETTEIARIIGASFLFLAFLLVFGERILKKLIPYIEAVDRKNSKLLVSLILMSLVASLADLIGLASIVGAFAAGLILQDKLFSPGNERSVEEAVSPLETVFAPIFFVLMGMQVDVFSFFSFETLEMALIFTVAGVAGKAVAGIASPKGSDRLSVGLGMIPRGEVGLIFASIGKSVGVIEGNSFSALVLMVILTTFITPVLLRWRIAQLNTRGTSAV